MIRVAQFSDLHYGHKTLAEADRCFGAAIDRAVEAGVQVAVISGDSTDHALDLHAPAALRLLAQVRRLAGHCPLLMLQGTFSHEPPGTLSAFRLLGARHPIHVAGRIEQVALTTGGQWLSSSDWRFDALPQVPPAALFSCVPTVNKAVVAAAVGAGAAAHAVGEQLAALLRGFAPMHRMARAAAVPSIGVSHGTVFGSISEHGVPMAGFDHEFTTGALFDAEAQAFMLGHIHRHQQWTRETSVGSQCIAYAGSIGRFHHGERGDTGFLLWDRSCARGPRACRAWQACRTRCAHGHMPLRLDRNPFCSVWNGSACRPPKTLPGARRAWRHRGPTTRPTASSRETAGLPSNAPRLYRPAPEERPSLTASARYRSTDTTPCHGACSNRGRGRPGPIRYAAGPSASCARPRA
jgi:exonuclease SbcD